MGAEGAMLQVHFRLDFADPNKALGRRMHDIEKSEKKHLSPWFGRRRIYWPFCSTTYMYLGSSLHLQSTSRPCKPFNLRKRDIQKGPEGWVDCRTLGA